MRWKAQWLAVLCLGAGCYDPVILQGMSCDVDTSCPLDERCIEHVCSRDGDGEGSGLDAVIDRDHDGIADANDNCPDLANPGQENEDGDKFGDACDLCPGIADSNADGDKDGVGDACDPHPTVAGDHIVLFEGFHQGIRDWRVLQSWTPVEDDVRMTTALNVTGALVLPIPAFDRATISASLVLEGYGGGATQNASITMPYQGDINRGIDCHVYRASDEQGIELYDQFGSGEMQFAPRSHTLGEPFTMTLTRANNNYSCKVVAANGGTVSVGATSNSAAATTPGVALRGYNSTVRWRWVMVVSSP